MLAELEAFLHRWENIWLFIVLGLGLAIEFHSNYMLRKEYDYDKAKDDKRVRRTKTSKKTTKADGSVTEEQSEEVVSPNGEQNEKV